MKYNKNLYEMKSNMKRYRVRIIASHFKNFNVDLFVIVKL